MHRNTSKTRSEHFSNFISMQMTTGRYGSINDVVRAGPRLLDEHQAKVKALEEALIAGEKSGEPRPFDFEAFKARKRAEYEGR